MHPIELPPAQWKKLRAAKYPHCPECLMRSVRIGLNPHNAWPMIAFTLCGHRFTPQQPARMKVPA